MKKPIIELSIIIGALREERRIGKTLESLSEYLKTEKLHKTTEIIVVAADGGDNTVEVVKKYNSKFSQLIILQPGDPVGKGRDIRFGMQSARGKIRMYMDADLATPLHHIKTMLTIFDNEKPDIVIGTRQLNKMHSNPIRRAISMIGNIIFIFVGGFYSPDTQCGFKGFTATASEICFSKMTRLKWSFDMEVLTIAHINKLSVQQIQIADWIDRPGGTFKPNFGASWQFFKDLIRIFTYRVSGKYKVASN